MGGAREIWSIRLPASWGCTASPGRLQSSIITPSLADHPTETDVMLTHLSPTDSISTA